MLAFRSRSVTTLVAAVAVLAAACSGDPTGGPTDEPTIDTFTPKTDEPTASDSPAPSETATGDPFAIPEDPADIDVAYVQRLLEDAIYPVLHRVIRQQVQAAQNGATEPPQEVFDLLDTIYDGEKRMRAYSDATDNWQDGEFVTNFRNDPKPVEVTVDRLEDVQQGCIVATFTVNYDPRLTQDTDPSQLTAQLVPKQDGRDPEGINPAPWVINKQFTTESLTESTCD